MTIYYWLLGGFCGLGLLFLCVTLYALCVVAGEADDRMEQMRIEREANKNV